MVQLVLLACLKIAPTACEEHALTYLPDVTALTCMMQAMPQVAHWSERHPAFVVERWFCRPAAARPINA